MIGNRIKKLREQRGMTQEQLAKLVSLSQQTIDHYEKGRARPSIDTVNLLADVFSVSADYLLSRTDDPYPDNKKTLLSKLFATLGGVMKDNRGAMTSEGVLLLLVGAAQLYAISKGIPPSVIAGQASKFPDLSEEEKARIADEMDSILNETERGAGYANKMAKDIEGLPQKKRQAMETLLDVLRGRDEDVGTDEDIGPEVMAAHRTDDPMDDLPEEALKSIAKLKQKYIEETNKQRK